MTNGAFPSAMPAQEGLITMFKKISALLKRSISVYSLWKIPPPPPMGSLPVSGMRPDSHDIEAVIRQALDKYEAGRERLGQLNLETDKRNFIDESIEEMLDAINYLCFQILKLRSINAK